MLKTATPFALGAAKPAAKSKVVIVRDANLRTPGPAPDPARVAALLDHAMQAYFDTKNPVEPWKRIVRPGQIVSLKVNCLGHPVAPNVALVSAICERLQQAGIKPGDITVWDRNSRDLRAAGFNLSSAPGAVRYIASDSAGYEDAPTSYGVVTTHLAKILTQSDVVLNLPVLKNHNLAGVTMAMKNMYGVINNPRDQHAKSGNPHVADLNAMPAIRSKMKLTIVDGLTGVYDGGPSFHPEHAWNFNGLLVSQDPVALDLTAWQIIDRARVQHGLQTLAATGRPPLYIATAADGSHKLGTDDPKRIALLQV